MGYDMRFVRTPEGEDERVSAARDLFYAAVAVRGSIPRREAGTRDPRELNAIPEDASPRYRAAQQAVSSTAELLRLEEGSYFRLNIWGMGRYADAMHRLGMAYNSCNELDWPNHEPYPDDEDKQAQFDAATEHLEDGESLTVAVSDDVMAVAREYVESVARVREHHPADGGNTIPLHKFSSNDGWIVTPAEIKAALAAYDSNPGAADVVAEVIGDERDHWDGWIGYLRMAVDHAGFEVW